MDNRIKTKTKPVARNVMYDALSFNFLQNKF